ncbi:hypothetical protein [Solidesulfovibrio carbinolicus]|uniref:hypothetical protein n=1 Tax=Solidesulfovibrio carbinolicus TaxID=296842 RepID=UPI0013E9F1C9|nr:hypothetical protein [Solidesulfovibrio carbinolicus]
MPITQGQKIEDKFDGDKLYLLTKEGRTEKKIMTELGIKSKSTSTTILSKS